MRVRKNISLSHGAAAAGKKLAAEQGLNFSQLVEKQLSAAPRVAHAAPADYWNGPALKPVRSAREARHAYLQRKHA